MKKILITGGTGFIGRRLQQLIDQTEYEVYAPSHMILDVTNTDDFKRLDGIGIDHVIHLAAKTFVPESWEMPDEYIRTNVVGTMRTLEFCKRNGCGLTYMSSYVYGIPDRLPVAESFELRPANPYALSKIMSEDACRFYNANMGVDITIFRPFNIYGYGQDSNFLLPTIVNQVLSNNDEIVVQTLMPKRDYIYIDDIINAIIMSIERNHGLQIYNLGTGISYSVGEIIAIAQKIVRTEKKVFEKKEIRKNEIMDVTANISAINKLWGWRPAVTINEGLSQYINQLRIEESQGWH